MCLELRTSVECIHRIAIIELQLGYVILIDHLEPHIIARILISRGSSVQCLLIVCHLVRYKTHGFPNNIPFPLPENRPVTENWRF
jgi:hypothetical protein